ncbi:MAG: YggS family pyridoxal phosphate-dependent enzyme [Clostridiales Family XIII bacterium]|jgi:pyridoxal phosphate enzyme (YggS family)|nr:YggS family pyridoxal phosphate-dependent enzyme [Clostridiales Family XIII bacterium]
MGIQANITAVENEIAEAADSVGRNPSEVKLIAVSKTRPAEDVAEALLAGTFEFGENRVRELLDKQRDIQDIDRAIDKIPNIRWNLIGHLQRNKVKSIINKIALLHSLDSHRLAREIELRAAAEGASMDVLIQVNAGGEAQKTGIAPDECGKFLSLVIAECPHIRVRGLMAVVPFVSDPEDVRGLFRQTRALYDRLKDEYAGKGADFTELSMGMTGDYKVAVEEGATMVRVGTAIFGERVY